MGGPHGVHIYDRFMLLRCRTGMEHFTYDFVWLLRFPTRSDLLLHDYVAVAKRRR